MSRDSSSSSSSTSTALCRAVRCFLFAVVRFASAMIQFVHRFDHLVHSVRYQPTDSSSLKTLLRWERLLTVRESSGIFVSRSGTIAEYLFIHRHVQLGITRRLYTGALIIAQFGNLY